MICPPKKKSWHNGGGIVALKETEQMQAMLDQLETKDICDQDPDQELVS